MALTVAILSATVPLRATKVAIIVTADRIVIAADSRVSRKTTAGQRTHEDTACKIWQRGTTVMTASGDVAIEGEHDLRTIAPNVLARPLTLREKFTVTVRELRRQQVVDLLGSASTIVLVLASYDPVAGPTSIAGKVSLDITDFNRPPEVPQYECTGRTKCRGTYLTIGDAGANDTEEGQRVKSGLVNTEAEAVRLARGVIEKQGQVTPKTVGGPIDVLVLDARGAHWVARKPECK